MHSHVIVNHRNGQMSFHPLLYDFLLYLVLKNIFLLVEFFLRWFDLPWSMIPLRRRGYCHDFGFTSEQEAKAWYFRFWSAEVARERIKGHNKLMRSYFVEYPTLPRALFSGPFWMGIKLFEHIAKVWQSMVGSSSKGGIVLENLAIAPSKRSLLHYACWHMIFRQILLMTT
jgi:hypothetical protein